VIGKPLLVVEKPFSVIGKPLSVVEKPFSVAQNGIYLISVPVSNAATKFSPLKILAEWMPPSFTSVHGEFHPAHQLEFHPVLKRHSP
jgi:hypothetical protein